MKLISVRDPLYLTNFDFRLQRKVDKGISLQDECLRKAELLTGGLDKKENIKQLLAKEKLKNELPITGMKVVTQSFNLITITLRILRSLYYELSAGQ